MVAPTLAAAQARLAAVDARAYARTRNALDGAVPEEVKQERWDRFMAHQQAISTARLAKRVGKEMDVLIDEVDEDGAVGRSSADAPEIDGNVYVDSEETLKPGDIVRVRVTESDEYDLWADKI